MSRERLDNRLYCIYGAAIALRLAIFSVPSVADALMNRVELSTPVTSYKRLTEGVFMFENSIPPYAGGLFHQAPLLLGLVSFFSNVPYSIPILYTAMDVAVAHCLQRITSLKQSRFTLQRLTVEAAASALHPAVTAALYLFNPLTILSCLSRSSILFTNLTIVIALLSAISNRPVSAMLSIALASYLSFYPIMLLPPLILFRTGRASMIASVATFTATLLSLLTISYLLVGSWDFIQATYGVILFLSDLTPTLGMFWYFFIEIFDQFRSFFMVVFQLHVFIFAAPLCIKFRQQPIFVATILTGIMAVFKSYPAAGDAALYLALIPIHDELFKYFRYGFLVANIFLYSSILAPIFWHLWLYAGSGNANFFYAITLVYNLGHIILLIDVIYACLRREFDINHPQAEGKVVVQK
ncbi:GPI transamidase subunit PIG-U [Syncephalastrum racemosum]|uniref:GPI transamidase subunit PIG-U n=1 Tax=Syncephalastrum racemosum TaxID=13706 RepID=A0A1X2HBE1_SYNRA|nr:GPI transamidase subunit PIG-U [Syncephalastrum racemosum]